MHIQEKSGELPKHKPVKVIGEQEEIFRNPYIRVVSEPVRFQNGHEGSFTYIKDDAMAVAIMPYEKRRNVPGVILVRQYRHPSDTWSWDIPTGSPHEAESYADAAARELFEESGCSAELWAELPDISAATRGNTRIQGYAAANLEAADFSPDDDESIDAVGWFPMDTVEDMILDRRVNTLSTIGTLAISHLYMRRNAGHPIAAHAL